MRRRDFVWPATLAALTSCVKKPASGLTSIEFGVQPYPNAAIIYLALERGYFRDAGFDVHLRVVTGASNISAAVVEGRLDAGTYSSSPGLFNAVARGARVRLVLGREIVNASCGDAAAIYARKKAFPKGTSDIRQWDGKRFATIGSRAGMDSFFLDTMLARAGLDPAKTPRFTLDHAQAVAAMIAGSMDAMVNGSPLPVAVDRAEIVRELAGARAIEPLQYSFICFGSRLLRRRHLDRGPPVGGVFTSGQGFSRRSDPAVLERLRRIERLGRECAQGLPRHVQPRRNHRYEESENGCRLGYRAGVHRRGSVGRSLGGQAFPGTSPSGGGVRTWMRRLVRSSRLPWRWPRPPGLLKAWLSIHPGRR